MNGVGSPTLATEMWTFLYITLINPGHCKKSCKICTDCDCQNGGECGEPEKNCTDTAQYATRCPNWAKYGYCTVKEYYSFMSGKS